ncbi:MAG: hypothetical protein ACUVWX_03720 [Kiritimatiellia bacterium]
MRASVVTSLAVVLLVLSLPGLVHGICAALAQRLYHEAKYGGAAHDVDTILRHCTAAQRLYPFNYYFHIWAAENAYYRSREAAEATAQARLLEAARQWCDTGLRQNHYRSELRTLKMRLLEMESVEKAIAYWKSYLEWHFWEPYNHAVMVELYAKAGQFEQAIEEMKWVRGTRHYEEAKQKLHAAWAQEIHAQTPDKHQP